MSTGLIRNKVNLELIHKVAKYHSTSSNTHKRNGCERCPSKEVFTKNAGTKCLLIYGNIEDRKAYNDSVEKPAIREAITREALYKGFGIDPLYADLCKVKELNNEEQNR